MRVKRTPRKVKLCECGCGKPVPIATYTARRRGYIKGQPNRYVQGHNKVKALFDEQYVIDLVSGCWDWTGRVYRDTEYGLFAGGKERLAHRASWVRANGPIPLGKIILHSCDNPSCVNPAHLSIGTYHDNTMDAIRKGRLLPFPVVSGELHYVAKLTLKDVKMIRSLYRTGKHTLESLGDMFSVSGRHISGIVRYESWKQDRL